MCGDKLDISCYFAGFGRLGHVIAATFIGAPAFGSGADGQALFLDGQADYVELGADDSGISIRS